MIIFVDLDNTCLAFSPHFEQWAVKQGHAINPGRLGHFYSFEQMFVEKIDYASVLFDFFACEEAMTSFPAMEHAVEPIQRLHALGHSFVAITACEPLPGLAELRARNLRNVFGFDFDAVHVTGYDKTKGSALASYEPSVWVEDSVKHAMEGAQLGYRTFLIDHPYNRDVDTTGLTRVADWRAIEEALCSVN